MIALDFLGRDWPGMACQVIDARRSNDDFWFQRDHIRPEMNEHLLGGLTADAPVDVGISGEELYQNFLRIGP